MLDELLGRAELKARIDELEEEKRHLERRLDAEADRRRDAVSARQDAEERVNRLEDRLEALEDRLQRHQSEERDLEYRGVESLRGDRLTEVLDRLRSLDTGPEGALSAAVADADALPDVVAEAFDDRSALVRRAAPCLALIDDAGLVCVALAPPLLPDAFASWDDGFRVDPSWFSPTPGTSVALVRGDLFAIGTYADGEWSLDETFESDVKAAHSKGGFSQARFERRRDEQIAAHVEKCHEAIDRHASEPLVCLGERTVLGEFEDVATHTDRVDASGDPEGAFETALREFWTTRLYRL